MKTTKLILTNKQPLEQKYGEEGFKKILDAIDELVEADKARGVQSHFVCLDDAESTGRLGVNPIKGKPTPIRCKRVIDKLCTVVTPDYIALLGADDVVPYFQVPNPSYQPMKDDDELVPTDNPYACSRPFSKNKRVSYLIPDRVIGRIPDLPGKNTDLSWLLDYLQVTRTWKSNASSAYEKDFMVCCESWRQSGEAVATYLSRATDGLMIAPPSLYNNTSQPPILIDSYPHLFHVIKCHGAPRDTRFYGQQGSHFPPVLTSNSLSGKTLEGTVVGAMCCYGAALFDPNHPDVTAEQKGDAPIPSVYLRQGAYGFVGSTTIAWVGPFAMVCADWIIASFMRYVTQGASTGRALLDSKQEFVRWINQQGRNPDIAEEKTLLQFHLLGDPAIHPIIASGEVAALVEHDATEATATMVTASLAFERRRRRSFRRAMATELRKTLPTREDVSNSPDAEPPPLTESGLQARDAALAELFEGFSIDERPLVHKVVSTIPETSPVPALQTASGSQGEAVVAAASAAAVEIVHIAAEETFQYYWTARRPTERVVDARMIKVETNRAGEVLRTQVLVTA